MESHLRMLILFGPSFAKKFGTSKCNGPQVNKDITTTTGNDSAHLCLISKKDKKKEAKQVEGKQEDVTQNDDQIETDVEGN
jgi:hypothetical protein